VPKVQHFYGGCINISLRSLIFIKGFRFGVDVCA